MRDQANPKLAKRGGQGPGASEPRAAVHAPQLARSTGALRPLP